MCGLVNPGSPVQETVQSEGHRQEGFPNFLKCVSVFSDGSHISLPKSWASVKVNLGCCHLFMGPLVSLYVLR